METQLHTFLTPTLYAVLLIDHFTPLDKEPTVFVLQETGQQRGAKEETALPLRQPAISKLRCPHVLYSTAVKFTGERLDGFCQLKDDGSSKIMKLNRARPFEIARAKVLNHGEG